MNTAGKHKRRRLSVGEHRERAQRFSPMRPIHYFDPQRRKKSLMGSALKHEALADELDKFNALENFGMM
jgi:hypothetical protein